MSNFDDTDLIRHVFGDAPPDLARAIEVAARQDVELAAKLEVMGWAAGELGTAAPPAPKSLPVIGWRWQRFAWTVALVTICAFLAGVAAGWAISLAVPVSVLSPEDKGPPPAPEHTRWEVGRPSVRIEKDFVT